MKFLFVTPLAESSSLAQKVQEEGHAVKFYIKTRKYRDVARGLVPHVRDWKKHKDWADVIIFDDVDMAKDIEWLRARDYPVVGGNKFGDKIENNRIFGQKIARETGLKIPKSWRFKSFSSAITFIKKRKGRYVIKFNGQLDRFLCYVSVMPDGSDLIKMIEYYDEKWPRKKKDYKIDFILQEYIDGVEMAAGAFFNGTEFVYPVNITFEHKRFLTGGIGPFTGEMGTSMYYSADGGKLFKETLLKIQPYLARTNYRGFIDINSMVTETGAYMLEFTARFGYPQVDIQQALHITPWGKLLYELAHGRLKKFKVRPGFAVGVIIGGAGMPFEISYNKYGKHLPIFGVNDDNRAFVKLLEVYKKNDKLYCTGGGYPLVINGYGKTMEQAQKKAYEIVKQIVIPNSVYRIDIGDHWQKEAPLLKKWGYL